MNIKYLRHDGIAIESKVSMTDIPDGGGSTSEVQIFPEHNKGEFLKHPEYGKMTFDEKFLDKLIENYDLTRERLTVIADYNHGSLEFNPDKSKAAGIVQKLFRRAGEGLWAVVDWTKEAVERIRAGEFLFISPEWADHHKVKSSGEDIGSLLHAIALTSRPFIEGMEQVKANDKAKKDIINFKLNDLTKEDFSMKVISKTLKLKDDATEKDVNEVIVKMLKATEERDKKLIELEAKNKELATKFGELEKKKNELDDNETKQSTELKKLTDDIFNLKKASMKAEVEKFFDDSIIKTKKMFLSEKKGLMKWAEKDFESFKEYINARTSNKLLDVIGKDDDNKTDNASKQDKLDATVKKLSIEKKIDYMKALELVRASNPELFVGYKEELND